MDIKEQIDAYTALLIEQFRVVVHKCEEQFMATTQNINFGVFCALYTIFMVVVLSRLSQNNRFRPQNRQLISRKQYYKQKLSGWFLGLPIIKGYVQAKIAKSLQQVEIKISKDIQKTRDPRRALKLPATPMSQDNLRKRVTQWHAKQVKKISTGKVSGTIYALDEKFHSQINDFAAKYMYQNPLHFDSFKQLVRIQSQVLKMTYSLVTKKPEQNAFGLCTSGGSESLMMALYAYRQHYSHRSRPNVVVPNSIHAAVDKGAFYFNIQVRKAKLNDKYQVDLKHLQSLIDSNTILIMGSCPNYPHGIVDPIQKLAKIGLKYNVGVHIDACLGGFVAGFDKELKQQMSIDRQGITSISLDHHKFGLAPKGISCVIFKTKQLRHSMYYINCQWIGGIYCTPSFHGSRTGFASAGAWYALTHVTKNAYKSNAKQVIQATIQTAAELRKVQGVEVFGEPRVCVVAFATTQVCSYDVNSYLSQQKGYDISSIHKPKGIHVSLTLANCQTIRQSLAKDVKQAIEAVKKTPQKKSETAAVYGASSDLPTSQIRDELIKTIIGATLK